MTGRRRAALPVPGALIAVRALSRPAAGLQRKSSALLMAIIEEPMIRIGAPIVVVRGAVEVTRFPRCGDETKLSKVRSMDQVAPGGDGSGYRYRGSAVVLADHSDGGLFARGSEHGLPARP